MMPLITIFGSNIPTSDFWAGMILLGTVAGIVLAGAFARNGNRTLDLMTGIVWSGVALSAAAVAAFAIRGAF